MRRPLSVARTQKIIGAMPCSNGCRTNLMVVSHPFADSRHGRIRIGNDCLLIMYGCSRHQSNLVDYYLGDGMDSTSSSIDSGSRWRAPDEENMPIPNRFNLAQNTPNPFNRETVINYQLPEAGEIQLEIFNVLGHKIKTLVNNYHAAGYYTVHWNSLDESGKRVSSGIYLYQIYIKASKKVFMSKKMVLLW